MGTFQMSDWIAIGAALIATLSALYARWAAQAVQRANEISLHNERLDIYKGLVTFRSVISARGPGFSERYLWRFYEHVQMSEFYFGGAEYKKLDKIFSNGLDILGMYDSWEQVKEEDINKHKEIVKKTHELHRETRDSCEVVINLLKPKLKIGKA